MYLTLQEEQQLNTLLTFVTNTTQQKELRSFIVDHPALLPKLLENFEQKKKIFASGDKKALEKLLEEERAMVASV